MEWSAYLIEVVTDVEVTYIKPLNTGDFPIDYFLYQDIRIIL